MFSIMGRNAFYGYERYCTNVDEIINCTFPVKNIDRSVKTSGDDAITASLLAEPILCRDGTLHLSSDSISQEDISLYIRHINMKFIRFVKQTKKSQYWSETITKKIKQAREGEKSTKN